jgi:hypothetical protein
MLYGDRIHESYNDSIKVDNEKVFTQLSSIYIITAAVVSEAVESGAWNS